MAGLGRWALLPAASSRLYLLISKLIHPHQNVMDEHGPLFVVAAVLIVAGIQMLAIGLLGELQVRHYHTSSHRAPYAIDRLVRLRAPEEPSLLSGNDLR